MRSGVRLLGLLTLLVGPATALAAEHLGGLASPYLRALESGAVGEVEGRAYGEPRRPGGSPLPYKGVALLAVPYAAQFDERLDAIKGQQRDSMASYSRTDADLTEARGASEAEWLRAGAGGLIRRAVSDAEGVVRLPAVPAGEWLLLGWREEAHHAVKGTRAPSKDAGRFTEARVPTGYAVVAYWRMRVTVRPGETTRVSLTDRGVWLTAIREEFAQGGPPAKAPSGSKSRR